MNRTLLWLRAEGAVVLALALWAYAETGGGWTLLLALVLLPDLSLLGYLRGARTGALVYNLAHSYLLPLLLLGASLPAGRVPTARVALVWIAHIGLDRLLGYGLKLSTGFRDTHLGRIGRGGERRARAARGASPV